MKNLTPLTLVASVIVLSGCESLLGTLPSTEQVKNNVRDTVELSKQAIDEGKQKIDDVKQRVDKIEKGYEKLKEGSDLLREGLQGSSVSSQ